MIDIVKSFLKTDAQKQSEPVKGKYYTRTGSCNQCGKCCTNIYLVHNKLTIETREEFEKLKADDPEFRYFEVADDTGHGLRFRCKHLQPDNSCAIYEDRPDFCRRYPSEYSLLSGGELAEGCGYSFQLINTFKDVLGDVAAKKRLNPGKLLSEDDRPEGS